MNNPSKLRDFYLVALTKNKKKSPYQRTDFGLFQLKEFADYNSNSDENGRKFSDRVENTVGKGEIARYEQFLLFPQCFQKTFTADR